MSECEVHKSSELVSRCLEPEVDPEPEEPESHVPEVTCMLSQSFAQFSTIQSSWFMIIHAIVCFVRWWMTQCSYVAKQHTQNQLLASAYKISIKFVQCHSANKNVCKKLVK